MATIDLGIPYTFFPRDDAQAAHHRHSTSEADPITDSNMPMTGSLIDRYGRRITHLRISLTDKCNLRCTYCMPSTNHDFIPPAHQLQYHHFQQIIRCALSINITSLRFTGGEPLLSPLLAPLIKYARHYAQQYYLPLDISLTTNAVMLSHALPNLISQGLSRVTISLDTLNDLNFYQKTARNSLKKVLAGIETCLHYNFPLKINTVIADQAALTEIPHILAYCYQRNIPVRFIEYMPLSTPYTASDNQHTTNISSTLSHPNAQEIRECISTYGQLIYSQESRGSRPAQMYNFIPHNSYISAYNLPVERIKNLPVGIIATMSEPFCHNCDRTRITSDGFVRNCLFSPHEYPLITATHNNSNNAYNNDIALTDEEVILRWRQAMWEKKANYTQALSTHATPARPMHVIGG